jgi:hypothetical protein
MAIPMMMHGHTGRHALCRSPETCTLILFFNCRVQVTGGGMHHKRGGRLPERGGRVLGVWAGEAKLQGEEDPVEDVLDRIEAHDLRNDVVGLINICARSFPLRPTHKPLLSALLLAAWLHESYG